MVGDNYQYAAFDIEKPADFKLPKGQVYEWYARQIQSMLPEQDGSSGTGPSES